MPFRKRRTVEDHLALEDHLAEEAERLAEEEGGRCGERDAEGFAPPSTGRLDRPEGRVFTVGQKEGCRGPLCPSR